MADRVAQALPILTYSANLLYSVGAVSPFFFFEP